MKIKICFLMIIATLTVLFASCASAGNISSNDKIQEKADFSILQGKKWELVKVETKSKNIELDRTQMNTMNQGNMFILAIDNERISGKAAPNNYSGKIINQEGKKITFSQIVSTKMASIADIKNTLLHEDEYFQLLQKTTSWDIINDNLILYTVNDKNEETKLIYKRRIEK